MSAARSLRLIFLLMQSSWPHSGPSGLTGSQFGGLNESAMNLRDSMSPVDWVKRVNRTWIVRHGLAERADEWLAYLEQRDDERLAISCETAQMMCRVRDRSEDPKPWFYVGLFSRATADEARQFLANHRLTPASLPAMWDDEGVRKWTEGISPETRALLDKLRQGLRAAAELPFS